MSKLAFNKLSISKDIKTVKAVFNDVELEIKQYLNLVDKQSIIDFAIQASSEYPYVNRVIADATFNLFMVLSYTNIELTTKKEKEDPIKVYDLMESSGLIDLVVQNIPEVELNSLIEAYENSVKAHNEYQNSFKKVLEDFMEVVPQSVEMIQSSLNDLKGLENLDILSELTAVTK